MNKEINIDLRRCLKAILKKFWLVVIIGALCFGVAFLVTAHNPREDEYTAETTVYSITATDHSSLAIYSDIITSSKVSEKAADTINITGINANKVKEMITVNDYSSTLVLGIQATTPDKDLAIMVANAVANAFVDEVNQITSDNWVQILDKAVTAKLSYDKQLEQLKLRIIAAFMGIFFTCVWISAREIFTRKVYRLSDMRLNDEIDIIGIVPSFDKKNGGNHKII